MSIRFNCPTCRTTLSISEDRAGSIAICPRCRGQVHVPDAPPPVASPAEDTSLLPFRSLDFGSATSADANFVLADKPRSRKLTPSTFLAFGITVLFSIVLGGIIWRQYRPPVNNQIASSKEEEPGGIRLVPAVKAVFGDEPSPEWEVVKRYVLRNSLNLTGCDLWKPPLGDC
jgi:hypothetical protein